MRSLAKSGAGAWVYPNGAAVAIDMARLAATRDKTAPACQSASDRDPLLECAPAGGRNGVAIPRRNARKPMRWVALASQWSIRA
jgi:hypothetical protein